MALADTLKLHIPYLRRHARLLTGSQTSGDAAVRHTLEALAKGELTLDTALSRRAAIYQAFHASWEPLPLATKPGNEAPEARLARIPNLSRRALLLTAVEGFSSQEAGHILGVGSDDVERLLVAAQSAIETELLTRILIIEDEPIVALDIEAIVNDSGHVVTATARTRSEALDLFRATRPGLVLADIQLADNSSGVDAVADILAEQDVPVIFITAFPERLLTGEGTEPTYLITKPFMPETVSATISQALFFAPGHPAPAEPA